jgi:hypothetical protein
MNIGKSNYLFWDINCKKLDILKDADFIIKRVLGFGDEEDYFFIRKKYDLGQIKRVAKTMSYPNQKSSNFWSKILNIPLNSMRCQKKLSTKMHLEKVVGDYLK